MVIDRLVDGRIKETRILMDSRGLMTASPGRRDAPTARSGQDGL
jgi:hypothetical protein